MTPLFQPSLRPRKEEAAPPRRQADDRWGERRNEFVVIFRSLYIWFATAFLMGVFFPIVFLVWVFERNELHPRTTAMVMFLSRTATRINPLLHLHIEGKELPDPSQAYVVVVNHQSLTDIPLVSHLPINLKWVAKASLFKVPFLGNLMKWNGDIPVDFKAPDKKRRVMEATTAYIEKGCNVIFFPEGRRSFTGDVARFHNGAFELAIQTGVPVLPIALDGLWDLLPSNSWKFAEGRDIHLKILEPISTEGLTVKDAAHLREKVRFKIMDEVAAWRGVSPESIDGIWKSASAIAPRTTPPPSSNLTHEPFHLFQHHDN